MVGKFIPELFMEKVAFEISLEGWIRILTGTGGGGNKGRQCRGASAVQVRK